MDIENKINSSSSYKTYNLITSRFPSLITAGFFGVLLFFALVPTIKALGGAESIDVVTVCILPLFSILLLSLTLFAMASAHVRLVISPVGIEYHQIGYSICTSWNNIKDFEDVSFGRKQVLGLVLYQRSIRKSKWLGWTARTDQQGYSIPIDPFMGRWQNRELEEDLVLYLPHLFEEGLS